MHSGSGIDPLWDAEVGKTLSVNAMLRELAPDAVCRVQFRARPTPPRQRMRSTCLGHSGGAALVFNIIVDLVIRVA
ncbi:hypothetical protein YT1_p10094 (plasmid) [Rhodococcus ruber]|nr:hypothetical protein YT1_p10094 [Rhodococcus ruber]